MVNNSSSGGNGSLIVPRGRCIMLEHVCALGKKSGIALLFSLGSFVKKKVFLVQILWPLTYPSDKERCGHKSQTCTVQNGKGPSYVLKTKSTSQAI